jgi:proton glutamate symport protein
MSLTARVLAGLSLGLAAGAVAHAAGHPALLAASRFVEPLGTLWVNAILMTVIPLVVSNLIVGVTSTGDARVLGRLGWQAILLFGVLAGIGALATALIAPPMLARLHIDATTSAALRSSLAATPDPARAVPTMGQWFVGLVPSNPFRAATEGALLPLVVFTLAFSLALTRVAPELRQTLIAVSGAVASTMRVLIEWILDLAPVGVFALTLPLAARLGAAAAGAVGYYFALVIGITLVIIATLYPIAVIGSGIPFRRFARAAAPAQLVAFSARSSLASLPALIQSAERLALAPAVVGVCLPLAVSISKCAGPVATLGGMLFVARLYGVDVSPAQIVQAAGLALLLSFASPGIPAGALLVAAPIYIATGLPSEGLGLLIAVDSIPDMFRTPVNVTGDLVIASILGRRSGPAALPVVDRPAEAAV